MKKSLSILTVALLILSMTIPALAAEFYVPSVGQTPTVDLTQQEVVINGETVKAPAIVVDKNGTPLAGVSANEIVVTPMEKQDEAANEEVKELLAEALKDIQSSDAFKSINNELDAAVKELHPDLKAEDLAVRDLFDITLTGASADIYKADGTLEKDGNKVELTVVADVQLSNKEPTPVVIFKCKPEDEWEVIPAENIKRNRDGSLEITFEKLCAVALLTPDSDAMAANPGILSPATGVDDTVAQTTNSALYVIFAVAGVLAIVAGGTVYAVKRAK